MDLKQLIQAHLGALLIAVAIVIAMAMYCSAFRYELVPAPQSALPAGALDRSTGAIRYHEAGFSN